MASNRVLRVGPVLLTNTITTNILNPAAAGAGTGYTPTASYIIMRHVRLNNFTAGAITANLFISTTGDHTAGKEFLPSGLSVAANSAYDWYGMCRLDSTDFLVGDASAINSMSITIEGEVGLA